MEALQQAIGQGEYSVPPSQIADAMLNDAMANDFANLDGALGKHVRSAQAWYELCGSRIINHSTIWVVNDPLWRRANGTIGGGMNHGSVNHKRNRCCADARGWRHGVTSAIHPPGASVGRA